MSPNFHFEKNCNQKEKQNKEDTKCDVRGRQQTYQNYKTSKGVNTQERVKYCTNGDGGTKDDFGCDCSGSYTCCSVRSAKSKRNGSRRRAVHHGHVGGVVVTGDGIGKYAQLKFDGKPNRHKRPTPREIAEKCYDNRPPRRIESCFVEEPFWQHGKYVSDDCGSGIVPLRLGFHANRRLWCKTPLTTYQATHGELGRKILCGEEDLPRRINPGPPCNVCELVLPMCRGYYRRYSCDYSPCDDEFEGGRRGVRNKIERYWEPCLTRNERVDVNTFAPQNMALAHLLRKKAGDIPCW